MTTLASLPGVNEILKLPDTPLAWPATIRSRIGCVISSLVAIPCKKPWMLSIDGFVFVSMRIVFVRSVRNLRIRSLKGGASFASTPGAIA